MKTRSTARCGRAAPTSFSAPTKNASPPLGAATTKTTAGMAVMSRDASTKSVPITNSRAKIPAASVRTRCATASTTARTIPRQMRVSSTAPRPIALVHETHSSATPPISASTPTGFVTETTTVGITVSEMVDGNPSTFPNRLIDWLIDRDRSIDRLIDRDWLIDWSRSIDWLIDWLMWIQNKIKFSFGF